MKKKLSADRLRWLLDFGSLRTRWTWGLGTLFAALILTWAATLLSQDVRHHGATERARLAAISRSLAVFLDADAHEKLAQSHPEKAFSTWEEAPEDLVSLCDFTRSVASANELSTPIRTLRLKSSFASKVAAAPNRRHAGALEVILTGEKAPAWRKATDYLPSMASAFFEEETTPATEGSDGRLHSYAPLLDAWGKVVGVADVAASGTPPLLGMTLKLICAFVLGLAALCGLLKLCNVFLVRLCKRLERLAAVGRRIAAGDRTPAAWRGNLSREVRAIAEAFEALRGAPDLSEHWEPEQAGAAQAAPPAPMPAASTAPTNGTADSASAILQGPPTGNDISTFELQGAVQEAIESVRPRAQLKGIEVKVSLTERVRAELEGDRRALVFCISALLRNAIKFSKSGHVVLRISRAVEGMHLRFEVGDEGAGIPWQKQPQLDESLRNAAERDPRDVKGELCVVSALAARMGGEIAFESQPGAGSRFWITAAFRAGRQTEHQVPRPSAA